MTGSAFSTAIENVGNAAYFGDPIMSADQYLTSVALGGVLGGTTNGIIAARNGRGFWNGDMPGIQGRIPTIKPGHISPHQKGEQGVQKAIKEFKADGGIVKQTEVTLDVNGTRIRVDIAGEFKGKVVFIEVKNGPSAGFTPNQRIALPKMMDGIPITPVGKNAANAGLIPNQAITKSQYILMIKKYN